MNEPCWSRLLDEEVSFLLQLMKGCPSAESDVRHVFIVVFLPGVVIDVVVEVARGA
jgi:hypothetical protein